ALATLHQAEATIKIKEANLERAKVDLERCTIYSPIDGIVISRNVDVGQTVAASMSAPVLFVIAKDLTKMQIDANVSEADVGTVEEGQDVTFTVDAFPGRTFIGKVVQVRNSPITVQNVVTYDTVIEVNNDDRKLKPGMTANVSLIVASKPGVLRIPNAALRFRPPEAPTNFTFIAKMLMTAGMKKKPEPFTNAAPAAVTSSNLLAVATTTWTGNETPDELMKKYREARDNGEVVPDSVRTKVREIFQQRGGGGGGGGQGGGQGGRGGGGPPRPSSKPATRTIWTFASSETLPPGETPKLKPVTVRTGISDGIYTEVLSGLEENSTVVTAVTLPKSTAPQQAVNPFGGGGGRGFGR
ncbi:MAG: efflux RND transporter periplasmic adaptor subunit, partial [Verrucomicrobia bacterium]|nr:efflux RND transporter periplasmic adaptor subunit [Verrucomicrobiota bacterium]